MNILLISGHGAGDPGASGSGYTESDLARQATLALLKKLQAYNCNVTRYPATNNAYVDNKNGKAMGWKNYNLVIEIHFNADSNIARGVEVLYKATNMKTLAGDISSGIAACGFINRGAKVRLDLKNMNSCADSGVSYLLIETCFIDNKQDMTVYKAKSDAVWNAACYAIASYYHLTKKAPAKNGWIKESGIWYYYKSGAKVKSAWQKDSTGKWCYLGSDGKQTKSKWVKYKNYWYWIKPNGYMAEDEWTQYKGTWYYLKADGKMATRKTAVLHQFAADGKCTK